MPSLPKPAYPAPRAPPQEWTLDDLKDHLQTAVILELHTIPLYLYSAFCLKPDDKTDARQNIWDVVIEEMLHLALAGNILRAVGGEPKLYGPNHTPVYPCELFYSDLQLHLLPPTPEAIRTFVAVEAPKSFSPIRPIARPPSIPGEEHLLPEYGSIGEFYKGLEDGLRHLDSIMQLFNKDTSNQFSDKDGVYGEDLTTIPDLQSALKAMDLIIQQGEGNVTGSSSSEPSHWARFKQLIGENIQYYTAVEDPITSQFQDNIIKKASTAPLYANENAMLACDAAYSYLLLSIEKSWTSGPDVRDKVVANINPVMKDILAPIARNLAKRQLGGSDEHAAPPFNLYQYNSGPVLNQLINAIKEASDFDPSMAGILEVAQGLNDLSI